MPYYNLNFNKNIKFTLPIRHYFICQVKLLIRSSLFCDFTQRRFVVTEVSGLHISPIFNDRAVLWPLKRGARGCSKTWVTKYQSTPRNMPEERRSYLHGGGRRKSQSLVTFIFCFWIYGFEIMAIYQVTVKGRSTEDGASLNIPSTHTQMLPTQNKYMVTCLIKTRQVPS